MLDLLLGLAGHEEEISAIHYYVINLNHWKYDRIISTRKSEILYTENSFPVLIVFNTFLSKTALYLGCSYIFSIALPFYVDFVFFLFWIDDQKILKLFHEKPEFQEASGFVDIKMSNNNEKISKKSWFLTKQYMILLGCGFLSLCFIMKDCYNDSSILLKWRINFLGFFMVFPMFLSHNHRLSDFKFVFILNSLFFFLDLKNSHQTLVVFCVNFFLLFFFRRKIICFFFGYLIFNLDIFLSYYVEKELPFEISINIFLWKLFIFLQIFLFFFLIIRPKKKLQKYASFITEMYFLINYFTIIIIIIFRVIVFLIFSLFSLVLFIESYEEIETKFLMALISNLQLFYIILLAELYFLISFFVVLVESYNEILQVYAFESKTNFENKTTSDKEKKKSLNKAKLGFFRNMTLLVNIN